jgi:hypothetical protein
MSDVAASRPLLLSPQNEKDANVSALSVACGTYAFATRAVG